MVAIRNKRKRSHSYPKLFLGFLALCVHFSAITFLIFPLLHSLLSCHVVCHFPALRSLLFPYITFVIFPHCILIFLPLRLSISAIVFVFFLPFCLSFSLSCCSRHYICHLIRHLPACMLIILSLGRHYVCHFSAVTFFTSRLKVCPEF